MPNKQKKEVAEKIRIIHKYLKGEISLSEGAREGEIKIVTRLKPNTKDRVELIIFDNGSGISLEQQKNLFKPFGNAGKGSLGLGLAVAQKLLHHLKGDITVKSTPGKSTLVTIELPAAA